MTLIIPTAYTRPQKEFRQPCQFQNVDSQDHYVELHAYTDLSYNVESKLNSLSVQAVPSTHQRPIQTGIFSTENAGTQYEPALFDEDGLTEATSSKDYGLFLQAVEPYLNSSLDMNLYADSENALKQDEEDYDAKSQSTLPEIQALSHAKYTRGKAISAVAYANVGKLTLVYMAVAPPNWRNAGFNEDPEAFGDDAASTTFASLCDYHILVWNLADNMAPLAVLVSPHPVTSIDVHPHRNGTVILAGTYAGSLIVYDLDNAYSSIFSEIFVSNAAIDATFSNQEALYNGRNTMTFSQSLSAGAIPQLFYPSVTSSVSSHHALPVTQVKWLPQSSQIVRNGELETSASPLGGLQFTSLAPDGYIKVWSLQCVDRDTTRSDLTVLYPFINILSSSGYPHLGILRPTTIIFPPSDEPSTFFIVGDAFGNLACTTWPVAVAATQAMDDDRRKNEREIAKDIGTTDLDAIGSYLLDHPTKGSFVTAFQFFLSTIFHLEYSTTVDNMLLAASGDGCKIWMIDKQCHVQTFDMATKGIKDEQFILRCNYEASSTSGFIVTKDIPNVVSNYSVGNSTSIENLISISQVITNLNLTNASLSNLSGLTIEYNAQDLMSTKRIPNMIVPVTKSLETDFPLFDFYEPVFGYGVIDSTITAACLSQARPSVLYIGNDRGLVSVFDISDRMHEPLLTLQICVGPVTRIQYIRQAIVSGVNINMFTQTSLSEMGGGGFNFMEGKTRVKTRDVLLVGDIHGTLHVLEIPKTLRSRVPNERAMLKYKFRRSLEGSHYVSWRRSIRVRAGDEGRAALSTGDDNL